MDQPIPERVENEIQSLLNRGFTESEILTRLAGPRHLRGDMWHEQAQRVHIEDAVAFYRALADQLEAVEEEYDTVIGGPTVTIRRNLIPTGMATVSTDTFEVALEHGLSERMPWSELQELIPGQFG